MKNYQKALQIAEEFNEFKILQYISGKSPKIKLECLNCGYQFERYLCHFIQYPHVCPICHPKGASQTISLVEAQRRIDNVYGEGYLTLQQYLGNNIKVDVKCNNCGLIFQSVPASLWKGRLVGCPRCEKTKSIGEARLERYFREHSIQYRAQERFIECKDKQMLPFDFYLPQYNICVEFQGEQHYRKNSLMWSETLIKHDQIKRDFCKEKGIKLIEIPYYDIDNFEKYFIFTQE